MTSGAAAGATVDGGELESVESFRLRARDWLAANLEPGPPLGFYRSMSESEEVEFIARARALQRRLFDGGFAGICFPREYGGLGLTLAHLQAFNRETVGYEFPTILQVPTFSPCAAVLLEFGTEEQKRRHIPAMLKGDEIWMQFLSEPSGGSDVAGALTTAVRDGDEWVINGSKIWTSGAYFSDYGLCLVRTNWDVPKHRGLSVFIIEIRQPGLELQRIEMVNGSREFCQEFMTDLRVPDSCRVGEVDDGWTIGIRWMFHERNAMGGGSPYVAGPPTGGARDAVDPLLDLARRNGRIVEPVVRDLLGEARMLQRVHGELSRRIADGMALGAFPDNIAAVARLMTATSQVRRTTIATEIAGPAIAAAERGDPAFGLGTAFVNRQAACIGGGTTEMARNNISERVLGMPREITFDKNVPYRDVPKGPPAKS
ncbi:MAG: acyl-CoA dehydrogenase family protein [Acidimicrobiia bacterium]|jgi:alkylation response protein AidB-like acyl-CoA dehydrogenase